MPKYHAVRLDGKEYRLRVAVSGLRTLTKSHDMDAFGLFASAAGNLDTTLDILEQALNWTGEANTNDIRDPEAFYDLLVDGGYAGAQDFNALLMDIAVASGAATRDQAGKVKATVNRMYDKLLDQLFQAEPEESAEPEEAENPTPAPVTA